MDITQLILDDHADQRQLFALVEQLRADDKEALNAVWARLRVLLDTHARAEEIFFYPELLTVGRGADGESPVSETRDAIKDHNEIRDAVAEVDLHEPGSSKWFAAVAAANKANSDHMAEEERQGLTDFRRNADLSIRHQLGVKFLQFESEHLTGSGVKPKDLDVESYVLQNQ